MIDCLQPQTKRRAVSAAERREWLLFFLLVGPNFLLFAVFTYWPLLYNGYLSFVRWDMLAPIKLWVGLDNSIQSEDVATVFAEVNDILVKEAEPVIQTLQTIEA